MSPLPKYPAQGLGEQVLWSMLGGKDHLQEIDEFEAAGGYVQLREALKLDGPELIQQVKDAGIRGRGGAGFPTGLKMGFIPQDGDRPRYVVCNLDESEPCTFKDRELIERLPHLLIEGCVIAAHAVNASHAFIYIRGEYLEPYEILEAAVRQARAKGYVGSDVMGSGRSIEVVVHRGAGAYICGEEMALLSSLNGFRGQPTVKPPFPAVSGLYASPTLLNNAETLATLPRILAMGGESYAGIGAGKASTGTKLFSLSGHVQRPGNYELDLGTPLRTLVYDLGGGIPEGRALKAIIPGGSSMPILTADQVDTCCDFDSYTAAGTMLGSGSVVVIDERVCMAQLALRVAEFYRHESCGKCTPCREGTRWGCAILARIVGGEGRPGDLETLESVCNRIMGNCLCPLGDAMAMPILSYLDRFRSDFERYLEPGFSPPDDTPLKVIVGHAVEHHRPQSDVVAWTGHLSRSGGTH